MSKDKLPTTIQLAEDLMKSFAQNSGSDKFGFVLSMYEWDEEKDAYMTSTTFAAENKEAAYVLMTEVNDLFEAIEDDNDDNITGQNFNLN